MSWESQNVRKTSACRVTESSRRLIPCRRCNWRSCNDAFFGLSRSFDVDGRSTRAFSHALSKIVYFIMQYFLLADSEHWLETFHWRHQGVLFSSKTKENFIILEFWFNCFVDYCQSSHLFVGWLLRHWMPTESCTFELENIGRPDKFNEKQSSSGAIARLMK